MKPDNNISNYHNSPRSEEVQDIIDRMPTRFGGIITLIVLGVFVLLMVFGWCIRYPDIVSGSIVINTPVSPIKLVALHSGQLNLNGIKSQSAVKKDDAIAVIENGVSYDTMRMVKEILLSCDPDSDINANLLYTLPSKISLGEVTNKYYAFLTSLQLLNNFNTDCIYDKQLSGFKQLSEEQEKEVEIGEKGVSLAEENDHFANKAYLRDSFLFISKVSAEAEFERSKQVLVSSKTVVNNAKGTYISSRKELQQTEGKIIELNVHKLEKLRELKLGILAAYNDLMDNITLWEQKYVLKAPFDGKIQFLKFWTNKQFVQAGDQVFTIVPSASEPYGQVVLPSFGAGKVKVDQEVVVKLNDYPYMEYGSVKGKVASISLTTNTERTKDATVETYLVTIKFDNGLTTNYGEPLSFKYEAAGSAEIITKDRVLIERLFDNLRYTLKR
jgi:hypothetical protein